MAHHENILDATVSTGAPAALGAACRGSPIRVTVRVPADSGSPPGGPAPGPCLCCPLASAPPAPAGPVPEAPKLTRENDSKGRSVLATGQVVVPLAKKEYSRNERRLLDLFGIELQEFSVGRGGVWSAPVGLLAQAQAAVRAHLEGRGGDPALSGQPVGVTSLRVPYAQEAIDADLAALYEALSLETIDLVVKVPDSAAPVIVTAVLEHVERVRGRGAEAVRAAEWHTVPLAAIGLRAYYAGPPAPIVQALADFCGVPYCRVLGHGGVYWVAALDGPTILASAMSLGLLPP